MADEIKISQLTERFTAVTEDEYFLVSEYTGVPTIYESKKIKKSIFLGYKSFAFQITQVGTSAPTLNILMNDLSISPIINYDNIGRYSLDLTGAGASSSSKICVLNSIDLVNGGKNGYNAPDATTVNLETFDNSNAYSDDIYLDTFIEIRIYY